LKDDEESRVFKKTLASKRRAYSAADVQEIFIHNLRLCLDKKQNDFASDTLLINAPLESLPPKKWREMLPAMYDVSSGLRYSEIFIVGFSGAGDLCLQIKGT
jgi:hypothetical protein